MKKLGQKLFLPLVLFLTASAVRADVIIVPKGKVEKEFTPICNIMTNVADYNSVQVKYRYDDNSFDTKTADVKANECLPIVALMDGMQQYQFLIDGKEELSSNIFGELESYIPNFGHFKFKTKPKITNYFEIVADNDNRNNNNYKIIAANVYSLHMPKHMPKNDEICCKIVPDSSNDFLLETLNDIADFKCPDNPQTSDIPCQIEIRRARAKYKIEPNRCIQDYAPGNTFNTVYDSLSEISKDGQVIKIFGRDYSNSLLHFCYSYFRENNVPQKMTKYFGVFPTGYSLVAEEGKNKELVLSAQLDGTLRSVHLSNEQKEEEIKTIEKQIKKLTIFKIVFLSLILLIGIIAFALLVKNARRAIK